MDKICDSTGIRDPGFDSMSAQLVAKLLPLQKPTRSDTLCTRLDMHFVGCVRYINFTLNLHIISFIKLFYYADLKFVDGLLGALLRRRLVGQLHAEDGGLSRQR